MNLVATTKRIGDGNLKIRLEERCVIVPAVPQNDCLGLKIKRKIEGLSENVNELNECNSRRRIITATVGLEHYNSFFKNLHSTLPSASFSASRRIIS